MGVIVRGFLVAKADADLGVEIAFNAAFLIGVLIGEELVWFFSFGEALKVRIGELFAFLLRAN